MSDLAIRDSPTSRQQVAKALITIGHHKKSVGGQDGIFKSVISLGTGQYPRPPCCRFPHRGDLNHFKFVQNRLDPRDARLRFIAIWNLEMRLLISVLKIRESILDWMLPHGTVVLFFPRSPINQSDNESHPGCRFSGLKTNHSLFNTLSRSKGRNFVCLPSASS